MTAHELNGKIICALEVPSDVTKVCYYMGYLQYKIYEPILKNWATDKEICNPASCLDYLIRTDGKAMYKTKRHAIELEGTNYKFLALSKDMTEEKLEQADITESGFDYFEFGYKNYLADFSSIYKFPFNTRLESFRTWEKSVGIVTVNAYGDEKPVINDRDVCNPNYGKRVELQLEWIKAQSLVKNIAYLVKEG